ncbi:MAG TPA: hypothetical protein DF364_01335, partial [Ruminococcaceae bacterium]|nr:hypothetical protein [Oscillospiraceae bacterium]
MQAAPLFRERLLFWCGIENLHQNRNGGKPEMTIVYLVRHAKSVGNTERIFQGRTNLGLSAEGQAQLPQLAERFRHIPLEAIYSSPLLR